MLSLWRTILFILCNDTFYYSMANVQTCKLLSHIFALALSVKEIKNCSFYLEKVGNGHEVQFSQLRHLMANVTFCKWLTRFCACSYRFRDINVSHFLPSKCRSKSRWTIFSIAPFDDKILKSTNIIFLLFLFSLSTTCDRELTHRQTNMAIGEIAGLPKDISSIKWNIV